MIGLMPGLAEEDGFYQLGQRIVVGDHPADGVEQRQQRDGDCHGVDQDQGAQPVLLVEGEALQVTNLERRRWVLDLDPIL